MDEFKTEIQNQWGELQSKFTGNSTELDERLNNVRSLTGEMKDLKGLMGVTESSEGDAATAGGDQKKSCKYDCSNIRWLIQNGTPQERAIGGVVAFSCVFLLYFIIRAVLHTAVFFIINTLLGGAVYVVGHVCMDEFLKYKVAERKKSQSMVDQAGDELDKVADKAETD